jgi:hypothetical protein
MVRATFVNTRFSLYRSPNEDRRYLLLVEIVDILLVLFRQSNRIHTLYVAKFSTQESAEHNSQLIITELLQ